MAKNEFTLSFTEVTVHTGRKKNIRLTVDGKEVLIPVDEAVYAYFREQFIRDNPSPKQRRHLVR